MKTIDEQELKVLEWAVDFLERYSDYYYDVEDPESDAVIIRNGLPTLRGILAKKDYKPKTKVVEKVIEKETISENALKNIISSAEKHARESIDPLFKFCVYNSKMNGTLYLTDDYEKALGKAKSLSSSIDYGFWDVCSIRQANDGSYKLYREGYYHMGEFNEDDKYIDIEFLHFDYVRNLFGKIEKI